MNEYKPLPPNAITALVTGILSIALSSLVIPGIILAIVGLNKARDGYQAVDENPGMYGGIAMLKAGRITSIVGVISSLAYILFWWLYIKFLILEAY